MANKKQFVPGEPFQFSRSKVELFIECPRCFYLDRVKGIGRPSGFPFTLNNAVDTLFKKEFDSYRTIQQPHPLLKSYGLDLVPFQHPKMEDWRFNFKGIQAKYKGYEYYGAVDDIWQDDDGTLYVVDYKATAKEEPVTELSTASYHDSYRRQMEFYQWLLRQNGFTVSDTGYFVYTTGDNTQPNFNNELKFRTRLIAYTGNSNWVEPILDKLVACASQAHAPASGPECAYCKFVEERSKY
jgi:RecB family exonuclease